MSEEIIYPHKFPVIFQCEACKRKYKSAVTFINKVSLEARKRDIPLEAFNWHSHCPSSQCHYSSTKARLVHIIEQEEFVFR